MSLEVAAECPVVAGGAMLYNSYMNRRSFLAAILALLGMRRIPKPIPAPKPVGEVFFVLNTKYLEYYISESPHFEYGFTGFKEVSSNIFALPLRPFITIKVDSPE
jgi:hypothetical protein